MPEKPMKVGEIAKSFGVEPNTIRNYCRRYAKYLSPAANPANGGTRLFSSRDFALLSFVHSALNEGMNHAEISMKLDEKSFNADGEDIVIGMVAVVPSQASQTAPEAAQTLMLSLSIMQRQIDAIQRRHDVLLRAALLWGVVLGATGALAFGAFVLWVLWLLAN